MKHKVVVNGGSSFLEVEPSKEMDFWSIVNEDLTVKSANWLSEATCLGMHPDGPDAIDVDNGDSDPSSCFGISTAVKVGDILVTPTGFSASGRVLTLEEIQKAADQIDWTAYCAGDI